MLLALDTSTRVLGIALYDGTQVLGETVWLSRDRHTVELAPAVDEILKRSGVLQADLKAVGVAIGPGSFTGLRIGLALAKGLALVHHLALIGVSTLDILAIAQPVQSFPMAVVLRAGRGRLAVGWYQVENTVWKFTGQLEVLTLEVFHRRITQPTLVCGELTENERRILARKHKNVLLASPAQSVRRPSFLAELAWQRWQSGQVDDPTILAPIYLHLNAPLPG